MPRAIVAQLALPRLLAHFEAIPDPRRTHRRKYPLSTILMLVLIGLVCNQHTCVDIAHFAADERDILSPFLDFTEGTPSHDTISRVLGLLDVAVLTEVFGRIMGEVSASLPDVPWATQAEWRLTEGRDVLALDGKVLRGHAHDAIIVEAWSSARNVAVAAALVDPTTNEIPVVQQLLTTLPLDACVVTADALHCQKETAVIVCRQHGIFVGVVKANQHDLYRDLRLLFADVQKKGAQSIPHQMDRWYGVGHGRAEKRQVWVVTDPDWLTYFQQKTGWTLIRAAACLQATRQINDKTTTDTRYLVATAPLSAHDLLRASRRHWSIENRCHWVLDVAFREDAYHSRLSCADVPLAVLRRLALGVVGQVRSLLAPRRSLVAARQLCARHPDRLLALWGSRATSVRSLPAHVA